MSDCETKRASTLDPPLSLSDEAQALCFLAGANSIFIGERLLTTPNPEPDRDRALLDRLGMRLRE